MPENTAFGLLVDPGNQLQQRRFATAGRADNRHEVSGRDFEINFFQKVNVFPVLLNGEINIF